LLELRTDPLRVVAEISGPGALPRVLEMSQRFLQLLGGPGLVRGQIFLHACS